jgi:hypothetical protein
MAEALVFVSPGKENSEHWKQNRNECGDVKGISAPAGNQNTGQAPNPY